MEQQPTLIPWLCTPRSICEGKEYLELHLKQERPEDALSLSEVARLEHLKHELEPSAREWLDGYYARINQGQGKDPPYDPLSDQLTIDQEVQERERCMRAAREVFELHERYPDLFEHGEVIESRIEQSQQEIDEILAALERVPDFVPADSNQGLCAGRCYGNIQTSGNGNGNGNAGFGNDQAELLGLLDQFPDFEPGNCLDQHNENNDDARLPEIVCASDEDVGYRGRKDGVPAKNREITAMKSPKKAALYTTLEDKSEDCMMGGTKANINVMPFIRKDNGIAHNKTQETGHISESEFLSAGNSFDALAETWENFEETAAPHKSETSTQNNSESDSATKISPAKGIRKLRIPSLAAKQVASSTNSMNSGKDTSGKASQTPGSHILETHQSLQADQGKDSAQATSTPKIKSKPLKSTHKKVPSLQEKAEGSSLPPSGGPSADWSWGKERQLTRPTPYHSLPSSPPPHVHPDDYAVQMPNRSHQYQPSLFNQRARPNPPMSGFNSFPHSASFPVPGPSLPIPQASPAGPGPNLCNKSDRGGNNRRNQSFDSPTRPIKNLSTPPTNHQYSRSRGSSHQTPGERIQHFQQNASPTPSRSPRGTLHRAGQGMRSGSPRGKSTFSKGTKGSSQERIAPIPFKLNLSSNLEFASISFKSTSDRDSAVASIKDGISTKPALAALTVVEPHLSDTTLKVSGPLGQNLRGKLGTLFPSSIIRASMN